MNATMQVALQGRFQTLLADTAGAVLYDPWATVPTGDDVVTSMWGQMVECEDPMVTDRCFVKYSSSGLERYIVYDQYNSCAQSWILLPGFNLLEQNLLIVVYLGFLIYLFLGVAIVADLFMASIEVITSKTKTLTVTDEKGQSSQVEVLFWNATVANLTLMALGSSAPEILLAVIETLMTLASNEPPGELGPATIVGSAAFNLLGITAVCMLSVPDGEVRKVDELPVFLVTSTFSLWAYIWLWIVFVAWTPDEITYAEAWITTLMFPLLVVVAYAADRGLFSFRSTGDKDVEAGGEGRDRVNVVGMEMDGMQADRKQIAALMRGINADEEDSGLEASKSTKMGQMAKWMKQQAAKTVKPMTRMTYRMNAVRGMFGRKHMAIGAHGHHSNQVHPAGGAAEHGLSTARKARMAAEKVLVTSATPAFSLKSATYSVLEKQGKVTLTVLRGGPLDATVTVKYHTEDGTATVEDNDYTPVQGTLTFKPKEVSKDIEVLITDDDEYEPDENFFVHLCEPSGNAAGSGLLLTAKAEVTIIDDDEPGILSFAKQQAEVLETATSVTLVVKRMKGADGEIKVDYTTSDASAVAGEDYTHTKGTLVFEPQVTEAHLTVLIPSGGGAEAGKSFAVTLSNPQNGAQLSKRQRCVVTFISDDEVEAMADKLVQRLADRMNIFSSEGGTWSQQFKDAITCSGGVDEFGEEMDPEAGTLVMHYLCITWKLVFAIVPPTDYYGGWAAFGVSLSMIGLVTLFVGEVAALLGCALGISDGLTAITFVALGTSLPDTFASKQAVEDSDNADAAIGNVTGSNSVNVFLGLGLPWVLATFWKGGAYQVPAGDLAFSVIVYTSCAIACIALLLLRRLDIFGGAELGGSTMAKRGCAVFLAGLWMTYVGLSAYKSES